MNKFLICSVLLLGTTTLAHADMQGVPAYITSAIADHSRPEADSKRDQDRKPGELVAFAGIKPGDKVADVMPGGGYFTRIFSKVVGPKGHVYAVIPSSLATGAPKRIDDFKAAMADPAYGNTTLVIRPYDQIGADEPLDVIWTAQNYHDVYGAVSVFAVAGQSGPDETQNMDRAAFKALKPGGVYMVIDHVAKAGSDDQVAKNLHRMDPAQVIAQAQAAGFVLEARSDMLANPQDMHDKLIFAPEIRGHTDQFVLKFRKPKTVK